MVLIRIFGQLFQVVIGPGTTEDQIALRRAPSWAGKAGEELAAALSSPQIRALTEMAGWAETNLQGVTGTTSFQGRTIPRAALQMRQQFNNDDFGGMSAGELREQRKARRTSISELRSAAQQLGKL